MKTICAMREVFRAMSSFETAFEKVYRITLNEAMILCILKDATERMTATNLSKSTDLSPSHTSKMLRILEEKGLIERRILNGNRRSFHIFLTAVGKEKQQLVDTAFSEIEKKALADISEKEFEQFMSVYHRIYSNLSGISEKQTENDTYLRKKEHTSNE